MGGSRQTLVTDTSIWIDLYAGGLLNKIFELPFELAAPGEARLSWFFSSSTLALCHTLELYWK